MYLLTNFRLKSSSIGQDDDSLKVSDFLKTWDCWFPPKYSMQFTSYRLYVPSSRICVHYISIVPWGISKLLVLTITHIIILQTYGIKLLKDILSHKICRLNIKVDFHLTKTWIVIFWITVKYQMDFYHATARAIKTGSMVHSTYLLLRPVITHMRIILK